MKGVNIIEGTKKLKLIEYGNTPYEISIILDTDLGLTEELDTK